MSRSGLMTRLFLVYRIGPNPCVRNPVFQQLERRPERQTVGYFELPDTEPAAHPIPGLHENHFFLFFAQMAYGNGPHGMGFPPRILKVKAAVRYTGNSQQEEIGQARWDDFPAK